jgi:hypothetical protein
MAAGVQTIPPPLPPDGKGSKQKRLRLQSACSTEPHGWWFGGHRYHAKWPLNPAGIRLNLEA